MTIDCASRCIPSLFKKSTRVKAQRSAWFHAALLAIVIHLQAPLASAITFENWQAVTLGAGSNRSDNWDGDLWDDLAEFALGSDPSSGLPVVYGTLAPAGLTIATDTNGSIVPSVWLPSNRENIDVSLETSVDLVNWSDSGLIPSDTNYPTAVIRSWTITNLPTGFVRLRIVLGASATTVTAPMGWSSVSFSPAIQTLGLTLQTPALYVGSAYDISGTTLSLYPTERSTVLDNLPVNRELYIEFTEGNAEGHCITIDLSQSTTSALALDLGHTMNTTASLPPNIRGDRFVIRARETLNEVFPKEWFSGGLQPTTSDRIERWNGTEWTTWWLLDLRPGSSLYRWVQNGDSTLAKRDDTPLSSMEGYMVRRLQPPPILHLEIGDVRISRRRYGLPGGSSFVSGVYPIDASPVQMGFTVGNGFTATYSSTTASRFNVWSGDSTPEPYPAWVGHWLFGASSPYWVKTGDGTLTSVNHSPLLKANRGFFFQGPTITPAPSYLAPMPPNPASFELPTNPLRDTDNDGLPDSWEMSVYGNLSNNGLTDSDLDSVPDQIEHLLLTNPNLICEVDPSTSSTTLFRPVTDFQP